jgi:alpha-beta hydrolase superfamily lysophospholipase
MTENEKVSNENNIIHDTYYWHSGDGLKMFAQSWVPGQHMHAVLFFVHDFGEYSTLYETWAAQFVQSGVGCFTYDFRGHGKSEGRRGYASSYHKLIKDLQLMLNRCRELFPDKPVIPYGHGLGANLLTHFVSTRPVWLDALVLTSPWFELHKPEGEFSSLAGNIFKDVMPGIMLTRNIPAEQITRDLRIAHEYSKDNKRVRHISLRLFHEILDHGTRGSKSIYKINVPMLVMYGSEDMLISSKAVRAFVRNASAKTTIKEWDSCFHELHTDPEKDAVFRFIMQWLDNVLDKQQLLYDKAEH